MDEIGRLHDKVDRIEIKIDNIVEQMGGQNTRLEVYNVELTKHIEGVELARESNRLLKEELDKRTADIEEKIGPIVTRFNNVSTVIRFLKGFAIFLAGLVGAISAWKSLR